MHVLGLSHGLSQAMSKGSQFDLAMTWYTDNNNNVVVTQCAHCDFFYDRFSLITRLFQLSLIQ